MESIRYIASAPLLLLIIGKVPRERAWCYGISAKIYDYAAAGKTVLTISEDGPSARMAKYLNAGPVVDPADTPGIARALRQCYRNHLEGRLLGSVDKVRLEEFEFRHLSGKLASVLDAALEGGATGIGALACGAGQVRPRGRAPANVSLES
jgi:hypothetical protein